MNRHITPLVLVILALPASLQAKHGKHNGQGKAPPAEAAPTPSDQAPSIILSQFINAHIGEILTPLGAPGLKQPELIPELKEAFATSASQSLDQKKPAYNAAMDVCEAMDEAENEREAAADGVKVSEMVHGNTSLGAGAQVNPGAQGWVNNLIALRREKKQQRALNQKAAQGDSFLDAAQKSDWEKRSKELRAGIFQLYSKECNIERTTFASARTQESQKKAISEYPQLGMVDSPLNKEFVKQYAAMKAANSLLLQDPDWPEKLAKQCADIVSSQQAKTKAK